MTHRIPIGNQYWFGLRRPPCQFLFGVCPCLQLFGNISYSLYSNQGGHSAAASHAESQSSTSQSEVSVVDALPMPAVKKKNKKEQHIVVAALALEMPD